MINLQIFDFLFANISLQITFASSAWSLNNTLYFFTLFEYIRKGFLMIYD